MELSHDADIVLEGVTAAAQLSLPALEESLVVSSVMEEICTLSAQTIANIPRSVRLLLTKVLAAELNNAEEQWYMGFRQILHVSQVCTTLSSIRKQK